MNILNISTENQNVTVSLSAGELIKICNILYSTADKHKDDLYYKLNGELMLIRDLCQYGSVDNFCLKNILECRNNYGNGVDGILSDDDIEIFNTYIENNDMPTAFANTDWCRVYSKIAGKAKSDKIKDWIDRTRQNQ